MTVTQPEPIFQTDGFQIGDLTITSRALMAPMMGYNEPTLRKIYRRHGSGYCVTEMIKPEQLERPNKTLTRELKLSPEEHPVAAQISGREPEPALKAASVLRGLGYDMIDLNFGCPLKKTCAKGRGAAMMREPKKVAELVTALVKNLDCPITVKLRAGWSDDEVTAPVVARAAVDAGAAAVCVHGRSKLGWYRTKNNLDIIRQTRDAVPEVPFIANGDVSDVESARRAILQTGADAVMIGRASVGNPWIFNKIHRGLVHGEAWPDPGFDEIREQYLEHARSVFEILPKKTGLRYARKYAFFYFAYYIEAEDRKRLGKARDLETLEDIVNSFAGREPDPARWPKDRLQE